MAVALAALGGCATSRPPAPLRGTPGEVTVLVFGAVDCPIANAYAPELAAIDRQCGERHVAMWYVYPADSLDAAAVDAHRRDFALAMPFALDPEHRIVRAVGATVTPEAAVLRFTGPDRFEVVYLGRIDDQYAGIGKRRARSEHHDLRDAIDAAASGQPIAAPRTTAYGCFIEPPSAVTTP